MKRFLLVFILAVGLSAAQETPKNATLPPALLDLIGRNPKNGFYMLQFNGKRVEEIPLDQITEQGGLYRLNATQQPKRFFYFEIKTSARHTSILLKKIEGDFSDRSTGLYFNCGSSQPLGVVPLDYMTINQSHAHHLRLRWPYLWNQNPQDPLGGFAIYALGNEEENDLSLAEIWAEEPSIPHPEIGRPWTKAEVFQWIDQFHQKFKGLSETIISAKNPEELHVLTDELKSSGINLVYLHTDTWREEYWPRTRSFISTNPKVFPKGPEDLQKYSEELHQKGMQLQLHSVSLGIGPLDPEFVKKGDCDPRLASWFKGRLEQPLTKDSQELIVLPNAGSSHPQLRVERYWDLSYFRVGKELIRCSEPSFTPQGTWKFNILQRGLFESEAGEHGKAEEVVGLYSAYGQNFVPDNNSSLLPELSDRYATFINTMGLDAQHYDGAEIHRTGEPWGFSKMAYLVARKLNRPTTSNTSHGSPSPWSLEYQFSRINQMKELHFFGVQIPVLIEEHRNASSLLDAHYEVINRIRHRSARLGFTKPEPMFGLSQDLIRTHGLYPAFKNLLRSWQKTIFSLTPGDYAYIDGYLSPVKSPLRQAGNHFQSLDVLVLVEENSKFYLLPTRVLQPKGMELPWISGQEFGPVGPKVYCRPNESVPLLNPYSKQTPGLVVKVLPASGMKGGPIKTDAPSPESSAKDLESRKQIDSYRTGADLAGKSLTENQGNPLQNKGIWPQQISPKGPTQMNLSEGKISVAASNPDSNPYWTEENFPSWSCNFNLDHRSALRLEIEGDGSGAVLVVQLISGGIRDYVVKLDFTGKREIVIPHGEVAWSNRAWGWRFETKHFNYFGKVTQVKMGFGYLPPGSTAKAVVTRLEILDSIPSRLINPVIRLGSGSLSIREEIESGQYLTYEKQDGVQVFDKNWNFIKKLPSTDQQFEIGSEASFECSNDPSVPSPWLEVQVLTRDTPRPIALPER